MNNLHQFCCTYEEDWGLGSVATLKSSQVNLIQHYSLGYAEEKITQEAMGSDKELVFLPP